MPGRLLGGSRGRSRIFNAIAALVLMLAASVSFAGGFDDRYVAAVGYYNQDGLQDIYIRQKPRIVPVALDDLTIPIPLRSPVEAFVLQARADGGFDLIPSLTAQERATLASWAVSSTLSLFATDLNVDGFKDLSIKGIAGSLGTYNQFVFANPTNGARAFRLRAVDPQLVAFLTDAYRWAQNPNYFEIRSLVNNWYELVEEPPRTAWWYADYLALWGYETANGVPFVAEDDDVYDSDQEPDICLTFSCDFDYTEGVWTIYATIVPVRPVYDDFNQHFNADAVDFGKDTHSSLQVLIDIISGQLGVEVGGGEKVIVWNDDNMSLEDAFWQDLLLQILLHDNYCAITLECSVTDITQVDMVVDRLGTGAYSSSQCGGAMLNFTHGTYQVTSTDGIALSGFTLERGGPDSTSIALETEVCTNRPRRVPALTYSFSLTSGTHKKYPNVPSLTTTSIARSGVLVHESVGAKGTIGCILVSKTPGTGGTFTKGAYASPKAASDAALNEIRKALVYKTGGVDQFLYSFGTLTIHNNGN